MRPVISGTARGATIALTAAATAAVLLTGTAAAAAPSTSTTAEAATPSVSGYPSSDPRRRAFRAHFRTYAQCAFFANHDRNPRTNGWDCRHGRDRVFPWEYWY
jgi:hypothetical protein